MFALALGRARKRDDNPLWHEVLTHNWDKVTNWAKRTQGKWSHRIQNDLDAGRTPSTRSQTGAANYRDVGQELDVFQMAAAMTHFDAFFRESLPVDRYNTLIKDWVTGRLDKALQGPILAKRKDFHPSQFIFCHAMEQMPGPVVNPLLANLAGSEKQKMFKDLVVKLRQQQANWRRHIREVKVFEDFEAGDYHQQLKAQSDAVDEAYERISNAWIQVHAASDVKAACRLINAARRSLADHGHSVPLEQVPVIVEWNLPKAGAQASKHIDELVSAMSGLCEAMPETLLHVVTPTCHYPCTSCQLVPVTASAWPRPAPVFCGQLQQAISGSRHASQCMARQRPQAMTGWKAPETMSTSGMQHSRIRTRSFM